MTFERSLSLAIAALFSIGTAIVAGPKDGVLTALALCIPLAFIWISEAIGNYTGWAGTMLPVNRATPEVMIRVAGWVLLLVPVGLATLAWMRN